MTKNNTQFWFSELKQKEVSFLFEPYLIRGKLNIIQAYPGVGKSFLTCALAAEVSRGGVLLGQQIERGKVWLQNAEDEYESTTLKRFLDCGGDRDNVFGINEKDNQFSFEDDIIEEYFEKDRPALAIFDPMQLYFGQKADMNRANQVRPIMAKLAALSEEYNVCTVLVSHLNKQSQVTDGISRSLGSIDFSASARSLLTIGQVPEKYSYSKNCRVIVHSKCNLAACGPAIVYEITSGNGVRWVDFDERISESEIFSGGSGFRATKGRPPSTSEKAKAFLEKYLSDGGKECKATIAEAEKQGVARSVLFEVKKEMGIISIKDEKTTVWKLLENAAAL